MIYSIKIANIDREILHISWTTWAISMKFSGKNIKSHKKPGFHPSFRRYIFRKSTVDGQIDPSPAVLGLSSLI